MEFPHLGKHCSEEFCKKLDFLPVKCDACSQIFCSEHFNYKSHSCTSAYKKDVQVPVCPMCGEPVPTPKDVQPDVTVGQHIDQFCKSEKKQIYTNRCCFKNCKKKELVPIKCKECQLNYCLKHRHTTDHSCEGPKSLNPRNRAAEAALKRNTSSNNGQSGSNAEKIQGNMSEDEALARALALSMEEDQNMQNNRPGITVGSDNTNKDKCNLS